MGDRPRLGLNSVAGASDGGQLLVGNPEGLVLGQRRGRGRVLPTELLHEVTEVGTHDEAPDGLGDDLGDIDTAPIRLATSRFQGLLAEFHG